MNAQSDMDVVRAGADAYQNFTTATAALYEGGPLIKGMRWSNPEEKYDPSALPAASLMRLAYCLGKLCGEAGEASEKFWKYMRDTPTEEVVSEGDSVVLYPEEVRQAIAKELGDAQWYVAQAARCLDISLGDIQVNNLRKLRDRARRGVLGGSGDDR